MRGWQGLHAWKWPRMRGTGGEEMVRAVENAPSYLMKEGVAGLGGGVTGQDLAAYVAVNSLDSAVLEIQSAGAKGW